MGRSLDECPRCGDRLFDQPGIAVCADKPVVSLDAIGVRHQGLAERSGSPDPIARLELIKPLLRQPHRFIGTGFGHDIL